MTYCTVTEQIRRLNQPDVSLKSLIYLCIQKFKINTGEESGDVDGRG